MSEVRSSRERLALVHLECGVALAGFQREHPPFPVTIGALQFSADEPDRADWLAVIPLEGEITTRVPLERRILVVSEPRGNFTPAYLNQFGILVSPFTVPGYRGVWYQSHGALSLWFGRDRRKTIDYQGLVNLPFPHKSDTISVVTSRKSVFAGHRSRLKFLRALRSALGPRLLVYGRGFQTIDDKAYAILPSKYHLVLENTVMPSYWTEKLSDAFVGYALPIVSGPPDLDRWFPSASFVPIDIGIPDTAIAAIVDALDSDIYTGRFDAIVEARNRVLHDERLCSILARAITANQSRVPLLAATETINPEPRLAFLMRARREMARFYWQMDEQIRHSLRDSD